MGMSKEMFMTEQEAYNEQYNQFIAGEKEALLTGDTNLKGTLPITFQIEMDNIESKKIATDVDK